MSMQLEENLLQRVNTLVQGSDLDFWRKGRFLVRTDAQLVSYKDGIDNYCCVTFVICSCSFFVVLPMISFGCLQNGVSCFRSNPLIKIMENMEYPRVDLCLTNCCCWWEKDLPHS